MDRDALASIVTCTNPASSLSIRPNSGQKYRDRGVQPHLIGLNRCKTPAAATLARFLHYLSDVFIEINNGVYCDDKETVDYGRCCSPFRR